MLSNRQYRPFWTLYVRLPAVSLAALAVGISRCKAETDEVSGIDFVRIGAVGNPAWQGDGTPGDRAVGRGSVNYEYSIGKYEVTTAQWVEFFNAAYDRPANDRIPFLQVPSAWSATSTAPTTPGGRRWAVPEGRQMNPVGDISWRMAAIYCNWLSNDKRTDRDAFMNGAYDVSSFGYFGNIATDQAAHNPGAKYWIPTWDEWLKAAHYDPNTPNADGSIGGWWKYSTSSDTAPISNPPSSLVFGSNGEANAGGWDPAYSDSIDPFSIPLGAYANITSPWGLYDAAGATSEWTEEVVTSAGGIRERFYLGSWWVDGSIQVDQMSSYGTDFPHISTFDHGLRIASAIPGPWSFMLLVFAGSRVVLKR